MIQKTQRKGIYIHLWHLWVTALILRLVYFLLALSNQDIESLSKSVPDSAAYISIANYILNGDVVGRFWIFQSGPGYGFILAIIYTLLGTNPAYIYLFNIIMGSLAPVFIYLFAYQLTERRSVSLVAGIFSVISPTSIALSNNILTDQPFFTFFAATLFLYVKGIKSLDNRWLILSGILAGLASYIRPTVTLWPFVFFIIPFFIPNFRKKYSYGRIARKAGLVAGIFLFFILVWSCRNLLVHDIFAFEGNSAKSARLRWATLTIANLSEEDNYLDLHVRWKKEDSVYFNGIPPTYAQQYRRELSHTWEIFKKYPDRMIFAFFENVKNNLYSGNFFPRRQVPSLLPLWGLLIELNLEILTHALLLFSFIGSVLFFLDKNYLAWVLLTIMFIYFTLITGFSVWQGTRLHYPAELSWTILISYALHRLCYSLRVTYGFSIRKIKIGIKRLSV